MCDCINNVSEAVSVTDSINILGLLFNIIVFGITSSFTHCIGMCGGIAMGQSAMRMIAVNKPTTLQKILTCISWEYYIGKAITYSILTFIVIEIGSFFHGNSIFQIVKTILLSVVICYLLMSSINVIYKILGRNIPKAGLFKKINLVFDIKFSKINNRILSRILIGICLGLIPCGVVYTAIGMIVSSIKSPIIALLIAFLFGLTTFPGLFILSYSGNIFFYRYNKILSLFYLVTALWNIKFLAMML